MKRILVVVEYYLPGSKFGGPTQSIANMVERLGESYELWIFTRDHDYTETAPYSDVRRDQWTEVGKARVFYASRFNRATITRVVSEVDPDLIYLNSFFAPISIRFLVLRRLGALGRRRVLQAPRGEFTPGAFALRSKRKKQVYIAFGKLAGFFKEVMFHASNEIEANHMRSKLGGNIRVGWAPDLPPHFAALNIPRRKIVKEQGACRFIFVSRISYKKNLVGALEFLRQLRGRIEYEIYGPAGSPAYWEECQKVMKELPANISISYKGSIPHTQVLEALSSSHFFLLPTKGENFCHAILESMQCGVPVLTSDQTPWLGLTGKKAGWDIPLEDRRCWIEVLQRCVDMDGAEYSALSDSTASFAKAWTESPEGQELNKKLFDTALQQ